MSKNKKVRKSEQAIRRIEKARLDYEKAMIELAPFLPKAKVEDVSTEGKWQTASSLALS